MSVPDQNAETATNEFKFTICEERRICIANTTLTIMLSLNEQEIIIAQDGFQNNMNSTVQNAKKVRFVMFTFFGYLVRNHSKTNVGVATMFTTIVKKVLKLLPCSQP